MMHDFNAPEILLRKHKLITRTLGRENIKYAQSEEKGLSFTREGDQRGLMEF